ncbi:hypothetical protein CHUAL_010239 [Chamberlinius hualienensis]
MTNRLEILEIIKSFEDKAEEAENALYEMAEAHVQWLKEVVETAINIKNQGRQSIRGDLMPKTPSKRGRKRKVKASQTADADEEVKVQPRSKKSVALKDCIVSLSPLPQQGIENYKLNPTASMKNVGDQIDDDVILLTETKLISNRSEDDESVNTISKQSPAKPPRKLKAKRKSSKENESPAKKVVPKGMVASQVKLYEEKIISHTPSPQKQLSLTILSDPNAVPMPSLKQIEAKVLELQISKMSLTRQRSSRIRCKKSFSKSASTRMSIAAILEQSRRKSFVAISPTSTVSQGFVTAENSPVANNDQVGVVNETQDSTFNRASLSANEKFLTKSVSLATTTDDNAEATQNDQMSDEDNTDVIMATPPKISDKSHSNLSKAMNVASCKVALAHHLLSPLPAYSGTGSSRKESIKKVFPSAIKKNSFFSINRISSTSPSGSVYRFGTPDKTMTPQHTAARTQRMALLEARAESVLKKREQYLKQKVESSKRKRELRNQRFLKSKEQQEKSRAAKIERIQEEEKKKMLLKKEEKRKQFEAERKQLEAEQKRLDELKRIEEQRKLEEKKRKLEREQEEARKKKELETKLAQEVQSIEQKTKAVVKVTDMFAKPNKLNATYNANDTSLNATYNVDNYEMTPKNRPTKLTNPDNYDINNLNENDSTDDEEKPKKPIPSWAVGEPLRTEAYRQYINPPKYELVFDKQDMFKLPVLSEVFKTKRKRFHQRTSSAVWTAPPALNSSYNYGH